MRVREYLPTKRNAGRRCVFTPLADPFFHQGGEVGCAVFHGFMGTPANMRPLADVLAAQGFTVYAPLLSGHGASIRDMDAQSAAVWVQDALAAYSRLQEAGCTKIIPMGLSMGGLLAAILAAQKPCAGLALMSTPFLMRRYLHVGKYVSYLLPYFLVPERVLEDPYGQTYRSVPLRKLRDLDRLAALAREALTQVQCPTLLLQSARDNRVHSKSVQLAVDAIGHARVEVHMLENSPHPCTYGPEKALVAQYALAFVQRL